MKQESNAMVNEHRMLKVIIAGGGTGGHIFPAIAIAQALKKKDEATKLLFVGAAGRMEMEKVPQAGFQIEALDIAGFQRSSLIKNLRLPFRILKSLWQASKILKKFNPDVVVGVGGYASFPVLWLAQQKNIPTVLQEQNSLPGKTNRLLGKKARKICVAFEGMEKFFPEEKIVLTGNPVRAALVQQEISREEALQFFNLDPSKKTLLVLGGSLGARSVNETIAEHLDELHGKGIQLIWQTGKNDLPLAKERSAGREGIWVNDFITRMEYAYQAADLVVSRAGAIAIAELCIMKKAVLLVPYPLAAEDHQTINAASLVNKNAAWMMKDVEVKEKLVPAILELAHDESKQNELKKNIATLAKAHADEKIADVIWELAGMKNERVN